MTYLEGEVELGDASALCRLQHIFLKVHISDLVDLHDLLLVDLLECVEVSLKLNERHDSIRAVAQISDPLEVLHTQLFQLLFGVFEFLHVTLVELSITECFKLRTIFI